MKNKDDFSKYIYQQLHINEHGHLVTYKHNYLDIRYLICILHPDITFDFQTEANLLVKDATDIKTISEMCWNVYLNVWKLHYNKCVGNENSINASKDVVEIKGPQILFVVKYNNHIQLKKTRVEFGRDSTVVYLGELENIEPNPTLTYPILDKDHILSIRYTNFEFKLTGKYNGYWRFKKWE